MRLPSAISARTRPLKTGRKVPVRGKMEENATRERRRNSTDGVEIEKEMEKPTLLLSLSLKKNERRRRHIYIRRSGTPLNVQPKIMQKACTSFRNKSHQMMITVHLKNPRMHFERIRMVIVKRILADVSGRDFFLFCKNKHLP